MVWLYTRHTILLIAIKSFWWSGYKNILHSRVNYQEIIDGLL